MEIVSGYIVFNNGTKTRMMKEDYKAIELIFNIDTLNRILKGYNKDKNKIVLYISTLETSGVIFKPYAKKHNLFYYTTVDGAYVIRIEHDNKGAYKIVITPKGKVSVEEPVEETSVENKTEKTSEDNIKDVDKDEMKSDKKVSEEASDEKVEEIKKEEIEEIKEEKKPKKTTKKTTSKKKSTKSRRKSTKKKAK